MSETGHTKNLEYFIIAREFARSWGARYNPSNPLLALDNLDAIIAAAQAALEAVTAAKTPYRNATAAAQEAFAPLNELTTRVMNAVKISGVSAAVYDDGKTYSRKIKGQRREPKPGNDPSSPAFDASEKANSATQTSRTQRIAHLDDLVSLLESQHLYSPNEPELRTATLAALSVELKARTAAVQTTFVELSNKRAARNAVFYADVTGLVEIGRLFKDYVESFGRKSPEWKQIKNLRFTKI